MTVKVRNSLRVLIEQTESKPMRRITESILADVEAGKSLTQACAKFPEVFNRIYLALLKAGESSGTLDKSLKRLADQQEKDHAMVTRIKNSLTYPAIVLAVIIGVLLFMVIGVVPQVQQLYHDLGKDLPAITNILVALTNFLVNMWWLVTIVLGLIIYFVFQFVRTDSGRHILAKVKLNVPVEKIWVSFERKMSCAVGKCGHCKIDETYICLEGPVFKYDKAQKLLD